MGIVNDIAGFTTGTCSDQRLYGVFCATSHVFHVPGVIVPSENPRLRVPAVYVRFNRSSQVETTSVTPALCDSRPLVPVIVSG